MDAQQYQALRAQLNQLRDARSDNGRGEFAYAATIPTADYAPWFSDRAFGADNARVQGHTLVDIYRRYQLWSLVVQVSKTVGDVLEVGVWRGGTGCLMAMHLQRLCPERKVYLCDTFTGVVKAGPNDNGYRGGEHADTDATRVSALIERCELRNVELLSGIFPEETGHEIAERRFSLGHIDVDTYNSAKDVFEWLWPRLSIGGAVVFDDYGFRQCAGVTRLGNELAATIGGVFLYHLNGQAIIIKASA